MTRAELTAVVHEILESVVISISSWADHALEEQNTICAGRLPGLEFGFMIHWRNDSLGLISPFCAMRVTMCLPAVLWREPPRKARHSRGTKSALVPAVAVVGEPWPALPTGHMRSSAQGPRAVGLSAVSPSGAEGRGEGPGVRCGASSGSVPLSLLVQPLERGPEAKRKPVGHEKPTDVKERFPRFSGKNIYVTLGHPTSDVFVSEPWLTKATTPYSLPCGKCSPGLGGRSLPTPRPA